MTNKLLLIVLAGSALAFSPARAQSIIKNGTFDAPDNPLAGWTVDYEWTDNSYYMGNKDRISVKQSEAGKLGVAHIQPDTDAGAKIESPPIPFDPNARYTAKLDVKGKAVRVYFAGYKWKPGIRPHDNPEPSELRMIYKGKNIATSSKSWKNITAEIPGKNISSAAKSHLKQVRFITLYIWSMSEGFVDNVTVKKTMGR